MGKNEKRMVKKIALEEHFLPPGYEEYWRPTIANVDPKVAGIIHGRLTDFGNVRLEAMDGAGIVRSILSVAGPGVHGEILEIDPPRLLVYSWIANWHDDTARRTVVRWELAAKSGGTHVKVTHSGLAQLPVARKDYSGGWPEVVEMLKQFIEKN